MLVFNSKLDVCARFYEDPLTSYGVYGFTSNNYVRAMLYVCACMLVQMFC